MKMLKFTSNLVPHILSGKKTATWRVFDDKNLQPDDELILVEKETGKEFTKARITSLQIKTISDITAKDAEEQGHEPFGTSKDLLRAFKNFYGDKVTKDTEVKMLRFELTK